MNVIREDPKRPEVLYVGTDLSVYVSLDGGREWHVLAGALPTTYVHDLAVHPRADILVAATHGRGMWALDARPVQRLTPDIMARAVELLPLDPAVLARAVGTAQRAQLYFWLKAAGEAQVTIRDAAGQTVREFTVPGVTGVNTLAWDLTPQRVPGQVAPQGGQGGRRGPATVPVGLYTVEVSQGGARASGLLQVSR